MADSKAKETKTSKANADLNPKADVTETTKGTPDFVADRVSDLNPTADKDTKGGTLDTSGRDLSGIKSDVFVDKGEKLAQEAVEKRGATGGGVELVEKDGVVSAVASPVVDHSDNGKIYRDERVNPRDTNAPDAGLTPDGRRIAD